MRNGQDLGRLLGARFERRLHDAHLDAKIEELRQLALDAADEAAAPTAIVDGLLLARGRAYAEAPEDDRDGYTDAEVAAGDALDAAVAETHRLADPLDALLDDLDAVADASIAQSVFSLTEGNVPEATATLSASATGETSFPRLRFADSRRAATTITHRLLLLVEPGQRARGRARRRAGARSPRRRSRRGWRASSATRRATPCACISRSRPPARRRRRLSRARSPTSGCRRPSVMLAPTGEQTGLGRLGGVRSPHGPRGCARPGSIPPRYSCSRAPRAIRRSTTSGCRAARCARSSRRPATSTGATSRRPARPMPRAGSTRDELEARVGDVRRALATGRAGLAAALPAVSATAGNGHATLSPDLRGAMLALAGFELPGGVPVGSDPVMLVAQAEALLAAVDRRLLEFDARVADEAAGWPALDELGRYRALRDRCALLIGHKLALAPRFDAADGAALDASFARPRLGSPTAATEWLAAAGRVDPGARRLRVATDLTEALGTEAPLRFALAQLPDHPDEAWVAVSRPTDERSRLCLLSAGAAPSFATGAAAGLVLGAWTEASRTGSGPPRSACTSTPRRRERRRRSCSAAPRRGPGSASSWCATCSVQTLDLAKIRLVGPQALGSSASSCPRPT